MSEQIYFITHEKHGYTIGFLLECFDCAINQRLKLLSYDDLFRIKNFEPGAFVFTDFDRLGALQLTKLSAFVRYVEQTRPGFPILNHPDRVLGRFNLLNHLRAIGLGRTTAHRLSDWRSVKEFPVFLRREKGHLAPLSDLIHSKPALEKACTEILPEGCDVIDIIIVRYLDYSDSQNVFRKYGAFKIGDRIYGEHLFHCDNWLVKTGFTKKGSEDFDLESKEYIKTNPHSEILKKYFEASGIDFGRADYCVLDGEINLFEINTNPTFISAPPTRFDEFDRHYFANLHDSALMTIPFAEGAPLVIPDEMWVNGPELTADEADRVRRKILQRKIRKARRRQYRIGAKRKLMDWIARTRS